MIFDMRKSLFFLFLVLGFTSLNAKDINKNIYKNAYKCIIADLTLQDHSMYISDTIIPLSCFYFMDMTESEKERSDLLKLQNDFYTSYYSEILNKLNRKVRKNSAPIVYFSKVRNNIVIADVFFRQNCLIKDYQIVSTCYIWPVSYSYLFYFSPKGKMRKYLKYIWN